MFAESSMNSGASAMRLMARAIACQSRSSMEPSRMRFIGTWASADSRRMVISVLSISREKITLAMPLWMEARSEEHTSELQSRGHIVCRLLLEKQKNKHSRTLDD